MAEGMTCYERDEAFCEEQMCLRVGCRIRNERLSAESNMPALDGLTAIDRLRLYATDPETFSFDIDDAIAAVEKYEEVERRADLVKPLVEALRRSREAVNAVVLSTHSVSFDADLRAIDAALQAYEAAQ